ncbi:MAG: hypothetical protein AVDCRST_MAG90-3268 [uncultured Microvirga sp.]|uniref:Type II secretion system protein GspF domain-containing protein n=1 Tax=uncultured Microvirga sp. TaxID=412392 RepID=A0A6J4MNP1_9HYPH|nr:MAG: hypothetical protein AVDCRST_MAG90-3268 [uncultured Microvirga sp.]
MLDPASLLDDLGRDPAVTFGVLGVVGGAMALVFVAGLWRDRREIRRRASAAGTLAMAGQPGAGSAGATSPGAAAQPGGGEPASFARLVTFLESSFGGDPGQMRLLRTRLIQAGFFDERAVAVFFGARVTGAVLLGGTGLMLLPFVLGEDAGLALWFWAAVAGLLGYCVPSFYLRRRIAERVIQHRSGFPDFMDLMVVCAEAGLSMEAAIDRIAREIVDGYPSLAENLYMVSLEIRAGKAFTEALERLGKRLGIEEASMLATLLQQSAELGTSLSQSLRIYSEEMRNKRMSRAEEKAYALPSKLVVPLMLFVFPVLIMTLMLPVVIRFSTSGIGGG